MMLRQARRFSAIQHDPVRCGLHSRRSYVAPSPPSRSAAKPPRKELTYCPICGFKPCVICMNDLTPALFCLGGFRGCWVSARRLQGGLGDRPRNARAIASPRWHPLPRHPARRHPHPRATLARSAVNSPRNQLLNRPDQLGDCRLTTWRPCNQGIHPRPQSALRNQPCKHRNTK